MHSKVRKSFCLKTYPFLMHSALKMDKYYLEKAKTNTSMLI